MAEVQEKPIQTINGPFTRERTKSLREAVEQAETPETMWEGAPLDVKYGAYLLEYVESEFAKRGHNGL